MFSASREQVADQMEWLAEHEPEPAANQDVQTKLQQLCETRGQSRRPDHQVPETPAHRCHRGPALPPRQNPDHRHRHRRSALPLVRPPQHARPTPHRLQHPAVRPTTRTTPRSTAPPPSNNGSCRCHLHLNPARTYCKHPHVFRTPHSPAPSPSPAWAAADLPKKAPITKYTGLWTNSPFTSKPPPPEAGRRRQSAR